MARPKKTASQRRAERFAELYRIGKARTRLTDNQIAAALGISVSTIYNHNKDPGKYYSINQLAAIGDMLRWTNEECLSVIHGPS